MKSLALTLVVLLGALSVAQANDKAAPKEEVVLEAAAEVPAEEAQQPK